MTTSTTDTLTNLIAGAVGDGLAMKFMAHRKVAGKMPKAADIVDGKEKELKIKEVSAMYSLTVSLCYELKDMADKKVKDWDAKADNFFRYMMDCFPTELVVMGAKTALTNYNLPLDATKLKNFDEFPQAFWQVCFERNGELRPRALGRGACSGFPSHLFG